jgi:hypothetical protein
MSTIILNKNNVLFKTEMAEPALPFVLMQDLTLITTEFALVGFGPGHQPVEVFLSPDPVTPSEPRGSALQLLCILPSH